jgi:hypothetical protein
MPGSSGRRLPPLSFRCRLRHHHLAHYVAPATRPQWLPPLLLPPPPPMPLLLPLLWLGSARHGLVGFICVSIFVARGEGVGGSELSGRAHCGMRVSHLRQIRGRGRGGWPSAIGCGPGPRRRHTERLNGPHVGEAVAAALLADELEVGLRCDIRSCPGPCSTREAFVSVVTTTPVHSNRNQIRNRPRISLGRSQIIKVDPQTYSGVPRHLCTLLICI